MMSTKRTPQLAHQKIVGFKVWYSDFSVYSSNDGMWNDAPQDDVQVVMVYFEKLDAMGRRTRLYSSGCDYYALNTKGEYTSDFDDETKVDGHILLGKFMSFTKLGIIEKIAFEDYGVDLTPKELNQLVR